MSNTFTIDDELSTTLEGFKTKLGVNTLQDVIKFSFQLVAYLDEMEKQGGSLVYMNPEGKIFKVALGDLKINDESLEEISK